MIDSVSCPTCHFLRCYHGPSSPPVLEPHSSSVGVTGSCLCSHMAQSITLSSLSRLKTTNKYQLTRGWTSTASAYHDVHSLLLFFGNLPGFFLLPGGNFHIIFYLRVLIVHRDNFTCKLPLLSVFFGRSITTFATKSLLKANLWFLTVSIIFSSPLKRLTYCGCSRVIIFQVKVYRYNVSAGVLVMLVAINLPACYLNSISRRLPKKEEATLFRHTNTHGINDSCMCAWAYWLAHLGGHAFVCRRYVGWRGVGGWCLVDMSSFSALL